MIFWTLMVLCVIWTGWGVYVIRHWANLTTLDETDWRGYVVCALCGPIGWIGGLVAVFIVMQDHNPFIWARDKTVKLLLKIAP